MLIMIVEIVLTITAFVRGWRFRALLPLSIGLGISFLRGKEESFKLNSYSFIYILTEVFILIAMAVKGRKKQTDVSKLKNGGSL